MKTTRQLLSLVAFSIIFIAGQVHAQGRGPKPVVIAEVYDAEVLPTQEFVGTVIPERMAVIGSAVDGRVDKYLIIDGKRLNTGDRVEAGNILASLLDETISQEIISAEAELNLREYELEELQAGSRPEEILQADALLQIAESRKKLAEQRLARIKKLSASLAVSEDELDEALAQLSELNATISEKLAAKKLIDEGPRLEKIKQAKARRDMQAAVLQKLKDQKRKHGIITRFSGYIVAEHTEEGAWVNRGDPIADVAALDNVDIQVQVLESYIPHIKKGMNVTVQIPSLDTVIDDQKKHPFTGVVISVIPQADARSRTFPVKVRVANTTIDGSPMIKSGMLARATLPIGPEVKRRLIPKDALVLGGPQPVVWVVDLSQDRKTGKVRPVPVTTGISSGTKVSIGEELKSGDVVVAEGNERLQAGAEVTVLREIAPPEPATTNTAAK